MNIPTTAEVEALAATLTAELIKENGPEMDNFQVVWTGGLYVAEGADDFWFTTIDNTSMPYRCWMSSDLLWQFESMEEVLEHIKEG
jgi:hypothetical protein